MKQDGILDYAEFQLSPRRTRCELFVSADGLREKIAAGPVKSFAAHLQEVEVQTGSGARAIRLENPSSKQQKDGNMWFRKDTLARFVRFVSAPEVVERVKTIEDEIVQLQQVHNTLEVVFPHAQDRSLKADSINDRPWAGHGTPIVSRAASMESVDNQADASRQDLLRAMETRLNALHEEQNSAFARATAAGFDCKSIEDLMAFAETFNARRLGVACVHFLSLSRERPASRKEPHCEETDSALRSGKLVPDEETCFLGPKRRLDFGVNTVEANQSDGFHVEKAAVRSFQPQTAAREPENNHLRFIPIRDQKNECVSGGLVGSCQQNVAQNGETRSCEDIELPRACVHRPRSPQNNELDLVTGNGFPIKQSYSQSQQSLKDEKLTPLLSLSLPIQRINVDSPIETVCISENGSNNIQNAKDEAPAKRLSVAAAISLFESKKKDQTEVPLKKLRKQESRRPPTENNDSMAEKSVLKRWAVNLLNKRENNLELKNIPCNSNNLTGDDLEYKSYSHCDAAKNPETNVEKVNNRKMQISSEIISDDKGQYTAEKSKASLQKSLIDHHCDNSNRTDGHTAADSDVQPGRLRYSFQQADRNTHYSTSKDIQSQDKVPSHNNAVEAVTRNIKVSTLDQSRLHTHNTGNTQLIVSEPVSLRRKMSRQVSVDHENIKPAAGLTLIKEGASIQGSEEAELKNRLANDRNDGDSIKEFATNRSDAHMQALVKMVENPFTVLSFNGNYVAPEIQGKYYDQYSRLRDAKLKQENPTRRAEKEAKMKLMQETLNRRRAEIQSKSLQTSNRKLRAGRVGMSDPRVVFHVEQNDIRVYNDFIDQEHQKVVQHDCNSSSLPYSSTRNQFSSIKSHATSKVSSDFVKPLTAQNLIRPAAAYTKPMSKANQGKMTNPEIVGMHNTGTKSNVHSGEWKKDMIKSTSIYATLYKSNVSS